MNDKKSLVLIHLALFLLQVAAAVAVVLVSKELVSVNVVLGGAQAYFPNPYQRDL